MTDSAWLVISIQINVLLVIPIVKDFVTETLFRKIRLKLFIKLKIQLTTEMIIFVLILFRIMMMMPKNVYLSILTIQIVKLLIA